jgi:tripartite ATP-independent transporter DctP family solute receptor
LFTSGHAFIIGQSVGSRGSGFFLLRPIIWINIIAAVFLLFGCSAHPRAIDYDQVGPEDKLILRFSYVTGEETPKGLAARKFKELVEARSGGKVEVQLFPNSSLYSDEEELEELNKGDIQLIAPATSKLSQIVPETQIFDLPYLFSSQEDVWKLEDGPVGQEINRLLEKKGYKVLGIWDNGFKQITNNEHPIKDPEDFNQLTFRIMPSGVLKQQFQAVNAQTLMIPFSELFTAVEKGKVDGEENTLSNINNQKLYMSQKYITKSDHGFLGYFVLTDGRFWNKIPAETQNMLMSTLQEVTKWERNQALYIDKQEYQQLKERQDIQLTELTYEQKKKWEQAFQKTYDLFLSETSNSTIQEYLQEFIK